VICTDVRVQTRLKRWLDGVVAKSVVSRSGRARRVLLKIKNTDYWRLGLERAAVGGSATPPASRFDEAG